MTNDKRPATDELEAAMRAAYEAGYKRGWTARRTGEWIGDGSAPTSTYEIVCQSAFNAARMWLAEMGMKQ